ncbi:MAG: hypothetical protein KC649_05165, partial [Candidatus Omnitrophica bacterium]|nr:hypothetical protein [Candidatus Omnitrophota bacterium]
QAVIHIDLTDLDSSQLQLVKNKVYVEYRKIGDEDWTSIKGSLRSSVNLAGYSATLPAEELTGYEYRVKVAEGEGVYTETDTFETPAYFLSKENLSPSASSTYTTTIVELAINDVTREDVKSIQGNIFVYYRIAGSDGEWMKSKMYAAHPSDLAHQKTTLNNLTDGAVYEYYIQVNGSKVIQSDMSNFSMQPWFLENADISMKVETTFETASAKISLNGLTDDELRYLSKNTSPYLYYRAEGSAEWSRAMAYRTTPSSYDSYSSSLSGLDPDTAYQYKIGFEGEVKVQTEVASFKTKAFPVTAENFLSNPVRTETQGIITIDMVKESKQFAGLLGLVQAQIRVKNAETWEETFADAEVLGDGRFRILFENLDEGEEYEVKIVIRSQQPNYPEISFLTLI